MTQRNAKKNQTEIILWQLNSLKPLLRTIFCFILLIPKRGQKTPSVIGITELERIREKKMKEREQ